MGADTPFLFSIAALSVSLAGFAGLVAAFHRGGDPRPIDIFRLRQIVEFGFANAVLALLPLPIGLTVADATTTLRAASVAVFVYDLIYPLILVREGWRLRLPMSVDPLPLVIPLNVVILGLSVFAVAQPSVAALEWLLLLLLVRPMLAFVLVLSELSHGT